MLQHLQITNFQAHSKLDIEFDPHITTLIGSSDAGKSSVLRALRWLCFNRPRGDAFIKHGFPSTKVKLIVDDRTIVRRRGKGTNNYFLDGSLFEALGTEVPPEISKLLNLSDDVCFQKQHDAPYWFSKTPGEVSKELNQIINLGLIDSTLANIASELRKAKATVELTVERLEQAEQHKNELSWAIDADKALQAVETIDAELVSTRQKRSAIASITENMERYSEAVERYSEAKTSGMEAVLAGDKLHETAGRVQVLGKLIEQLEESKRLANITIPIMELKQLEETQQELARKQSRMVALNAALNQIEGERKEQCQVERELQQAKEELEKESKGECPICGKSL